MRQTAPLPSARRAGPAQHGCLRAWHPMAGHALHPGRRGVRLLRVFKVLAHACLCGGRSALKVWQGVACPGKRNLGG